MVYHVRIPELVPPQAVKDQLLRLVKAVKWWSRIWIAAVFNRAIHSLLLGAFHHWGIPKMVDYGWFIMEHPKKGWFGGTRIFGNLQMNIDPEHHQVLSGNSSSNPYLAGSMLIYQRVNTNGWYTSKKQKNNGCPWNKAENRKTVAKDGQDSNPLFWPLSSIMSCCLNHPKNEYIDKSTYTKWLNLQ